MRRKYLICFTASLLCFACACATHKPTQELGSRLNVPPPLRNPNFDESSGIQEETDSETDAIKDKTTVFAQTPNIPEELVVIANNDQNEKKHAKGEPVAVNFEGLSLPAFINAVYGDVLKESFEIKSGLEKKTDLVTLRTKAPLLPDELDRLARQVLENYGVFVQKQGEILRFATDKKMKSGPPPLMASGQALPSVPVSHRPVFQLVPLKVVRNTNVRGWLKKAYKGQDLEIFEDPERNAVLLMGPHSIVQMAMEAVKLLDQPNMRGYHSMRIEPVSTKPTELAKILVDVLNTEGYSASLRPPLGSIIILPVDVVNAVFVFAGDEKILAHVKEWAESLDSPKNEKKKQGFFYYQVRNTGASDLAAVLGNVLPGLDATKDTKKGPASARHGIVVDKGRNGIIFQGDEETWEGLIPVIQKMDLPSRMVLIEVTVAEITLDGQEELGIDFLFNDIGIGNVDMTVGTSGGMGLGAKGLTFTLDNAGQTRAMLNAFASKSRVKILSTPRVMVKSGSSASIDVGSEVPIITSQSTSPDLQENGTSSILQQIQYRKTGVLLKVKPVVYSGNQIDLDIIQEVSESQPGSSGIDSPNIFNRRIETTLGLKDGGSVLLGGLISSTKTNGASGVPVLSDIPLLGRLFRVDTESEVRTELMMLIIPYIINNNKEAEAVTKAFRERL